MTMYIGWKCSKQENVSRSFKNVGCFVSMMLKKASTQLLQFFLFSLWEKMQFA